MPIIRYLEVTIGRDSVELDTFKKFKQNLVLNLDTIMRFTQNDLFRRYELRELEQRRFDSLHVTNELHLAFRMYISCFHRRDSSCAINSYTPHVHVTSFGTWNGMVSPFCCCKAGEASHTEQKLSEQLIRVITRYYERETWWEF